MTLVGPPPGTSNPFVRLAQDIQTERHADGEPPPGLLDFNIGRTRRMARDPLRPLLDCYERYGPVFTMRILHMPVVWMIGPQANHHILVSHARDFNWREGSFGDLIPLLGDGLLTIDGEFHDASRRIVMPVFHRERVAAATATIIEEGAAAIERLELGAQLDLYHWTRALALRIAMRALLGFGPGAGRDGSDPAHEFETALSFYGTDFALRVLRGPLTPWRRLMRARERLDRLIFAEIERRRAAAGGAAAGAAGGEEDRGGGILSLLLDASDEHGNRLSDRQVRDEVMTLLFAGHDTTTSTVTFLFHELARNPRVLARLYEEQDRVLGGRTPTPEQLVAELPELDMALDETLRLYPPAWVGPRRANRTFEFAGRRVPAGLPVNYSSWVTHRLPEIFPEPEAFLPERFTPERKAALPKGAYVPFGGGSRICVGMRFGQMEVKALATMLLQRFRLELRPGYALRIRQMPTLSPADGLPVVVRERGLPVA